MTDDTDDDGVMVVCMRITDPLKLPDNKIAPCAKCGMMCQYRPHNPPNALIICMDCVADEVGVEAIRGTITPETKREIEAFLKRRMN